MAIDKQRILTTLRKVGIITMWCALVLSLTISLAFVNREHNKVKCSDVIVHLQPETDLRFINRPIILETISPQSGENGLKGKAISSLRIPMLEQRIASNKFVRHADVYTDMNGVLHVNVDQKIPILRIINARGETFYLDQDGQKIPESPMYTAHVPVATGNIFEGLDDTCGVNSFIGSELFKIATYVDKDAFWKAQIEQIFVTAENELVLIPKIGNHTIRFGNTPDMEVKFAKLLLFYREALSRIGWEKYSDLDLRFKDQIVCKKKTE